jgi:hypothetical protein
MKDKEQYLKTIPSDNTEWAAQQIMIHFSKEQIESAKQIMDALNRPLYKSWAKEMTLTEIAEAIDIAYEFEFPKKESELN